MVMVVVVEAVTEALVVVEVAMEVLKVAWVIEAIGAYGVTGDAAMVVAGVVDGIIVDGIVDLMGDGVIM
jgi:hypothetical protein